MKTLAKTFLAACALSAGVLSSAPALMAQETLRLGTSVGYPPFEYIDDKGEIAGFDIDVGNAICAYLNKTCTWENIDFAAIIPALKARKFDAVHASIAITDERRKQVDFTDVVYGSDSRLIARKDSGMTLDIDVLKTKRIGVEQGSTNDRHAKKFWAPQGVEIVAYADQDQALADLIAGRIDAFSATGLQVAVGFLAEERGQDFDFVGGPLEGAETDGAAIAVTKGNTALVEELNRGLAAIKANGTFDQLAAKYFPPSVDLNAK